MFHNVFTEGCQSGPKAVVLDLASNGLGFLSRGGAGRWGRSFRQGSKPGFAVRKSDGGCLGDADAGNRVVAIAGIHLLAQLRHLHGQHFSLWASGQDNQCRTKPLLRIADFHRCAYFRDRCTNNFRPMGQQPCDCKTTRFTCISKFLLDQSRGAPKARSAFFRSACIFLHRFC